MITSNIRLMLFLTGLGVSSAQNNVTCGVAACLSDNGPPVLFNCTTQMCTDGVVVNKTITDRSHVLSTSLTESSRHPSPGLAEPVGPDMTNTPCPGDELTCGGTDIVCGRRSGSKCCGFSLSYRPDFETCCRHRGRPKVHGNSPESLHVCCDGKIYPRNGSFPCRHPARNDILYGAKKGMKILPECRQYLYVVHPKLAETTLEEGFKAYNSTVEIRTLSDPKLKTKQYQSLLYDDYSPPHGSKRCRYIVVSTLGRKDNYEFFAKKDDVIVKICRRKKVRKLVKKWMKRCRRQQNRLNRRL